MESLKQRQHRITYIDYSTSTPLKEGVDYEDTTYEDIQKKRIEETLKYIATIKNTIEMSNKEFEELISASGVIKK